nr:hypothetical protein B0A51_13317 [Rachicladosporium sp. CCFEE 5018]
MPLFLRLPRPFSRRKAKRTRMAIQIAIAVICLLIVLPAYIIYKPPRFVISYFQGRFPSVLFHVQTTRKIIALTIDDAPSAHTSEILEVLKKHNATATFFVIGDQVNGREGILTNILQHGHELGNHATHDEPSISLPSDVLAEQISSVDSLLNDAYTTANVTRQSFWFRPGSGVFSQRVLDIAEKADYKTVLGSIYPHDPFIRYWRVNAWHVLSMARPGAVIICHDRRSWTAPMLKRVLTELHNRGFEVVSVSKLLEATKG